MIPSDLAARLRMLTEASFFDSEPAVQGTARVREIQARLPELLPGQKFTATLQESLPDGTYKAIVAGRNYTLALNHAAKAGDTLELVVTQSTPRAVISQLANPAATPSANPSSPSLSPAGKLISFLLTGQPPAKPAELAGGNPLLPSPPPGNGATLAPLLRQALAQSGLFYESHQNQWLAGKIETATLRGEPQGTMPPPARGLPAGAQGAVPAGARPATAATTTQAGAAPGMAGRMESPAETGEDSALPATQASQSTAAMRGAMLPDRLMPIVHQQLDALATQNYVWHGQVWPGQSVEWEIEDPERDQHGEGESKNWNTTLRLTLPRLGGVEAQLQLTSAGVALRLIADDAGTVSTLSAARNNLDEALSAANVPLTGFVAEKRDVA